MNFLLWREFKLVNLLTHWVKNLKSAKQLGLKLSILVCLDILAIELNLLVRSKVARLHALIMNLLLQFLNVD